jgi:iron complex transport system substrate-binding protein
MPVIRNLIIAALLLAAGICHAADAPKRIVSLAPSITESLYQLGLEASVAGITTYCPRGTTPKQVVGTLWEPDIERILALAPDLVVASKEGNRKAAVLKMRELGLNVCILDEDRDFESICANFRTLGAAVGKAAEAQAVIARTRASLAAIQKRTRRGKPVRVFWEVGARPLFTISRNSFINDYGRYTGSVNIFDDVSTRYPKISREEVLRRDPDALIIVAMGDVTRSESASWQRFPGMAAVRNNRIYVIASQEIFTPTPLTFLKGAELIAGLLHP